MRTSIIIRTKDGERWIEEVLTRLYEQTDKDFEVVIVDSGSTDATLDIVSKFPVTLVQIKAEEFTYPYALNLGVEHAKGEKYLVVLSDHAIPVSKDWLETAVKHLEEDEKAMGVYGQTRAMPDGTFWDKLIYGYWHLRERLLAFPNQYKVMHKNKAGVLAFTNAMVRRELWENHHFNEAYGSGGEDGEWARHWFNEGYHAIQDLGFSVHHSHYLNLRGWRKQIAFWKSLGRPGAFETPFYRNLHAHKKQ